MSNTKVLRVAELARRTAAASAHLAGVRLPGIDRCFDELLDLFKVMLSPGNLSSRGDWLEKSRLWRLILLQQSDGSFKSTESLAFALQAHEGAVPPRPKPKSKLRQLIAAFFEDEDFDVVEAHGALLEVVLETAGGGDKNIKALLEGCALVSVADAAINTANLEVGETAEVTHGGFHLHGEFARRLKDEAAEATVRAELLERRQREGSGFTCAGLCRGNEVAAL
jgi:hypothetical protein